MTKLPSLNPHKVRARIFGETRDQAARNASDAGFTLIEIMGTIGIVAVLALAAVPQLGRAMEKANVQNLVSDMNNLAIAIEGDQSLLGGGLYQAAALNASCTSQTNTSTGNVMKVAPTAGGAGYIITGYNPVIKNYLVSYNSTGSGANITKTGTPQVTFVKCT